MVFNWKQWAIGSECDEWRWKRYSVISQSVVNVPRMTHYQWNANMNTKPLSHCQWITPVIAAIGDHHLIPRLCSLSQSSSWCTFNINDPFTYNDSYTDEKSYALYILPATLFTSIGMHERTTKGQMTWEQNSIFRSIHMLIHDPLNRLQ